MYVTGQREKKLIFMAFHRNVSECDDDSTHETDNQNCSSGKDKDVLPYM
jgi:hypothetical protein